MVILISVKKNSERFAAVEKDKLRKDEKKSWKTINVKYFD